MLDCGPTPDVSELGHCATQARRLPFRLTEGEPPHDQRSQGASALVRGAVGVPPTRVRVRGPRAELSRPLLPRLIDRARRTLRPRTPPRRSPESSSPRVRLHLKPGQKGTKQLLAQHGDRLICVRYRYDAQREKRFKTVELLVAERDWEPPRPRFAHDQIVGVRVAFAEVAVRDRVKQAGGTWNPERRVWQLRYDRVAALGLNSRIVDEPASNSGYPGSSGGTLHPDARAPSR